MRKFGILQTAFLGDTALISSMVDKINDLYGKDAEIHLIIKNGLEDLFKNDKRIHSITTFDKRDQEKGLFGLLKAIMKVRRLKLDVLFSVHRSLRSGVITILCGAKTKIGFKEAVLSFLFTKTVKRQGPHEVLKNHLLLEAYDASFKKIKPMMSSKYRLCAPAKSSLDALNKTSKEPFMIIAPGSKWHTKRWDAEGYTKLTEKLLKTYNHDIVFTGDKDDKALIEKIISGIKSDSLRKRIINLANRLNISDLMFLISRSSMVITNDSAPQHIAVGFNVPVVSIFGPTVRNLGYYPFSEDSIVVEAHDIKCRPCGLHGHMKCPKGTHECMITIKDEAVYNAVRRLI